MSAVKNLFKRAFRSKEKESEYPEPGFSAAAQVEMRSFNRYILENANFSAIVTDRDPIELMSLSYGGLSLAGEPQNLRDVYKDVELRILDQRCTVTLNRVHGQKAFSGYQFVHDKPDSLLFLRNVLEGFRIGRSLSPINSEMLKQQVTADHKICLRGDGPTDIVLVFKNSSYQELDKAILTSMNEGQYFHCEFRAGEIFTGGAIDSTGVSVRMANHETPDKGIVRRTIYILSGMKSFEQQESLRHFVEALFTFIKK